MNSIVFLSYDEPNADKNWEKLKARFPGSIRIHGVSGILEAHKACAAAAKTEQFFLVDGDNEVLDGFQFSCPADAADRDAIHVWRCKNPVNQLVYGFGAIKLYSQKLLMNPKPGVDLATSVANKYKIVSELASITHFNTSPHNSWRSAFRECVKLSSQVIHGHIARETQERLDSWCAVGEDQPFGSWCVAGARAGRLYGITHAKDKNALGKINDFNWLKNQFEQYEKDRI